MNVAKFIAEKCTASPLVRCKASELFAFYRHHGGTMHQRTFTAVVRELAPAARYGTHRFPDGTATTGFVGLAPADLSREVQGDETDGRTLHTFVHGRCLVSPEGRTRVGDLYAAYVEWSGNTSLPPKRFTALARGVLGLMGATYGVHRFDDGTKGRGFKGVALVDHIDGAHLIPTHAPVPVAAQILDMNTAVMYGLIRERRLAPVLKPSPRNTLVAFEAVDRYTNTPGRTARLRIVCDLLGTAAARSSDERRAELQDLRYSLRALRFGPASEWVMSALECYDDIAAAAEDDPGLQQAAALMESLI